MSGSGLEPGARTVRGPVLFLLFMIVALFPLVGVNVGYDVQTNLSKTGSALHVSTVFSSTTAPPEISLSPLIPQAYAATLSIDDFNSWSGWTTNSISGSASGGIMSGTITAGDPFMSKGVTSFSGTTYPYTIIRMSMSSPGTSSGQIFWAGGTSGCSSFSETCSKHFTVFNDGVLHMYSIDLTANSYWYGKTITAFRIDPSDQGSSGSFQIDYIWVSSTPVQSSIIITSSPTGSNLVTVDSTVMTTPTTYTWTVWSTHTLAASSPIDGGSGKRYVWQSWSDGGGQSHTYTTPDVSQTVTATYATLDAAFTSNDIPTTMTTGQSYTVHVTAQNAGTNTWTAAAGYKLGAVGDSDPFAPYRISLDAGDSIGPGQSKTFTFTMTAPSTPNSYVTDWQMVCEGVTWFGATLTKTVTVQQAVAMTVSYQVSGGGSPTAPSFNYVLGGQIRTYTLTLTGTVVSCDPSSVWSVTPNPLTGSGASEQWLSSQTLTGTVSTQTLVFTFYHQYVQVLDYAISGTPPGSPTAPTFTAIRCGVSTPQVLTTTATSYWYDNTSPWTITDPLVPSGASERWHTSQAVSGTISAAYYPGPYVFTYSHQYYLGVSSAYGTPTGAGWYASSSTASSTVTRPLACGTGCQYETTGYTGTGSAPSSSTPGVSTTGSFTITAYSTVTWNWNTQYRVTFADSGAGDPWGTVLTVNGAGKSQMYMPYTAWFDSGSTITYSFSSPMQNGPGIDATERYLWASTSGLGQSAQSGSFPATASGTVTATYTTQYKLEMDRSPSNGGSVSPGNGWHDPGTVVPISASPNSGYVFREWQGSYAGTNNPANITIGGYMYVTAYFNTVVTMTVSYQAPGGGSPTAPVFSYVQSTLNKTYTLTGTATQIKCDTGSTWSVTPNPLTGSGASEQWYSSQTLTGTVSTQTTVFTFYHQYPQTLSYTVSGGGSGYAAPIFTANKNGASAPQTLTTSATAYWYDSGSSWSVTNPLGGSGGSEQWFTAQTVGGTISSATTTVLNYQRQFYLTMLVSPPSSGAPSPVSSWRDAGVSVQISADPSGGFAFKNWTCTGAGCHSGTDSPATISSMTGAMTETANFVGQVTMTVSYQVPGGGSPTAPTFNYVQGGQGKTYTLTGTANSVSCDGGSVWSVTPNPLGGSTSSERWYSGQALSGVASTQTAVFSFYHQYLQTLSYSIAGGGSPTDPTFTATRNGVSAPQTLTGTPVGYWYDDASSWAVSNPLSDSGSERWDTTQSTSGTVSSPLTVLFTYDHQYMLTMLVDPPGTGSTRPSSGWQDAGAVVNATATATPGYGFQSWTGSGTGSYTGTDNPTNVTMDGDVTETANFVGQSTMTVSYSISGGGTGYSPPVFNYVQGGVSKQHVLTGTPTGIWCDGGSSWSVTPDPLSGSAGDERWYSDETLSGSVSEQTIVFVFYHQYLQTLSYTTVDGGSGYSAPTFTANRNGTTAPQVLTGSAAGYWYDDGSAWSATNPLSGSSSSEQWTTSQSTSGTITSEQTAAFSYQHQYSLTMQVSPTSAGTVLPGSGWQNAGASIGVSAQANPGHTFQLWTGTGSGNYSGSNNPASVTMNDAINETASFAAQITMTVSYTVTGGGSGYSAPTLNYVQGGSSMQHVLTVNATGVLADTGSAWSVAPNPLAGSGASEQWISGQPMNGTVSVQSIVFTYQHQYYLTMLVSPSGAGSTLPASDWQNSDASIGISTNANPGHTFFSWTGSGSGSYTGTDNPASVTTSAPITETANFAVSVNMTVSYSVAGDGYGYSPPIFHYIQGGINKTYTLTTGAAQLSVDSGTSWLVTFNPLTGSDASERWYSTQLLDGTASGQTIEFTFQHQYMLTLEVEPSGKGTTTPTTGWQNAEASVTISASSDPGYSFQDWSGSGPGNYTGSSNPSSVTMDGAITEIAELTLNAPTPVTMTVSYSVAGGGSPTAPVFNYVQGGISKHATLNQTAGGVQCASGSAWSVTPNPLTGSGLSERWLSSQALSGTASTQSKTFSFQHQYYLTMGVSPSGAGSTTPSSGWQNSGASVHISASAHLGHAFQLWTGSGSGSYSGSDNPATITMDGAVSETAVFTTGGLPSIGTACTFSSSASVTVGAPVFSTSQGEAPPSLQQLLLPLSQVLPASGLVANRRARRGLKNLMFGGRHGGLSGLASIVILVILAVSAVVGVAAYYYGIGSGATSQSHMIFSGSVIKVNSNSGTGTVYIKMYNEGSGSVRIRSLNITANSGDFNFDFSSGVYGVVSAANCNCTIAGGSALGMGGSGGSGFLNLPGGTTTSMMIVFNSGITNYFEPGTQYPAVVIPVQAAEMPFNIPSQGGQ